MKRRMSALLLALTLVAAMFVAPVHAEDAAEIPATTDTCPCGCGKTLAEVEWKAWKGTASSGHFYLDGDYVQAEQTDVISGEVSIALPQSRENLLFNRKNAIVLCGHQPDMIRRALEMNVNCLVLCQAELPEDIRASVQQVYVVKLLEKGETIEPNGSIKVAIQLEEGADLTGKKLMLLQANGTSAEIAYEVVEGKLTFVTEAVGTFVLVDATAE